MTARQNTVTPAGVLASGKTVPSVCNYYTESTGYVTTIYVMCEFINGNNILKCVTTCHKNTEITVM